MDDEDVSGENPTEGADGFLSALEIAIKHGAGIEFYSTPREDPRVSNQDILLFHKDGVGKSKIVRDILASPEDAEKMGQLFSERFDKFMQMKADRIAKGQKQAAQAAGKAGKGKIGGALSSLKRSAKSAAAAADTTSGDSAAEQGIASGLRAAAEYLKEQMLDRILNQKDNAGTPLVKVGEDYAEQRQRKYMIAANVVFQATSQLARAMANGKYRLFKDKSKVSAIASEIKNTGA
jgi:hypothetical protein